VRISPIQGCAYRCQLCDTPFKYKYKKHSIDDLTEAISVALNDEINPARHILISGGTPFPKDFAYMDEIYMKVSKFFKEVPVDVMMAPRPNLDYSEKLYSWGINEISYNIELYNNKISKKIMPQKYKLGFKHYIHSLKHATLFFGKGNVRSLIIVGLEPIEDTLKGIEALVAHGCQPIISPFRPTPTTPLSEHPPPSEETLIKVYERGTEIIKQFDLKFGSRCIPCHHNTLTFPDNSGFYSYF